MKRIDKIFLLFLLFHFSFKVFAGGFCSHNKGQAMHKDFCSKVNEANCQAHGNICNWTEVDNPRKPVAKPAYYCIPKRGIESQEEECAEYGETLCRSHDNVCEWR